jgi:hypothetical protein
MRSSRTQYGLAFWLGRPMLLMLRRSDSIDERIAGCAKGFHHVWPMRFRSKEERGVDTIAV